MSKTDKTQPYDVKAFFYPEWIEEYHDHTEGPCDLPPRPRKARDEGFQLWQGGRRAEGESHCYWATSYSQFWTHGLARCSCYACGYDAYESIPRRKRERIEGKRYCQGGWRDEY